MNDPNGYRGDAPRSVPIIGCLRLLPGDESNWHEQVDALRERYGAFHELGYGEQDVPGMNCPRKADGLSTSLPLRPASAGESEAGTAGQAWTSPSRFSRAWWSWWPAGMLLAVGVLSTVCGYLKSELLERVERERDLLAALNKKSLECDMLTARENRLREVCGEQGNRIKELLVRESGLKKEIEALENLASELKEGRAAGRKTEEMQKGKGASSKRNRAAP